LVYKVIIDPRENCISCCNCHTNCPEVFETNDDDGLSQIVEKYRVKREVDTGSIPDALEECVRLTEDLCPMSIIYLEQE
jgi:ferredoxin